MKTEESSVYRLADLLGKGPPASVIASMMRKTPGKAVAFSAAVVGAIVAVFVARAYEAPFYHEHKNWLCTFHCEHVEGRSIPSINALVIYRTDPINVKGEVLAAPVMFEQIKLISSAINRIILDEEAKVCLPDIKPSELSGYVQPHSIFPRYDTLHLRMRVDEVQSFLTLSNRIFSGKKNMDGTYTQWIETPLMNLPQLKDSGRVDCTAIIDDSSVEERAPVQHPNATLRMRLKNDSN